jgi:hypothetical protein
MTFLWHGASGNSAIGLASARKKEEGRNHKGTKAQRKSEEGIRKKEEGRRKKQ